MLRLASALLTCALLTAACGSHTYRPDGPGHTAGTTVRAARAASLVTFARRLVGPNLQYEQAYADFVTLSGEQSGTTPTTASLVSAGHQLERDMQSANAAIRRMRAIPPPKDVAATYRRYLQGAHDQTRMWRDLAHALLAPSPAAFDQWNRRSTQNDRRDANDQEAAGVFQIDMVSEYQLLKLSIPSWVTSIAQ